GRHRSRLRRPQGDPRSLCDRGQDSAQHGNAGGNGRADSSGDCSMAIDPVSQMQANSASGSNGASGSNDAASAGAAATVNYNDFLQLLIAQMKTQDPTEPMDASAQIAQLASFSQVEQQIQTNSHFETALQNQYVSQAADYIGKQIMSADGSVTG